MLTLRALNKKSGEWWYGDSTITNNDIIMGTRKYHYYTIPTFKGFLTRGLLDISTLRQYTGKKDKNGLSLYEAVNDK